MHKVLLSDMEMEKMHHLWLSAKCLKCDGNKKFIIKQQQESTFHPGAAKIKSIVGWLAISLTEMQEKDYSFQHACVGKLVFVSMLKHWRRMLICITNVITVLLK